MVKLSISLPNSTQITLESDEFDVINQVLCMLLNGMPPGAAPVSVPAPSIANGHDGAMEKGTDATDEPPAVAVILPQPNGEARHEPSTHYEPSNGTPFQAAPQPRPAAHSSNGSFTAPMIPASAPEDDGLFLESQTPESREDFTAFCQAVNPMGDMRRVVVAAEGAARFFRADGVSAEDLGELFDLAGWRRANSFTQTLRNAARSKFGWLERVPGRAGCYAPTDLGRSVTLGS